MRTCVCVCGGRFTVALQQMWCASLNFFFHSTIRCFTASHRNIVCTFMRRTFRHLKRNTSFRYCILWNIHRRTNTKHILHIQHFLSPTLLLGRAHCFILACCFGTNFSVDVAFIVCSERFTMFAWQFCYDDRRQRWRWSAYIYIGPRVWWCFSAWWGWRRSLMTHSARVVDGGEAGTHTRTRMPHDHTSMYYNQESANLSRYNNNMKRNDDELRGWNFALNPCAMQQLCSFVSLFAPLSSSLLLSISFSLSLFTASLTGCAVITALAYIHAKYKIFNT